MSVSQGIECGGVYEVTCGGKTETLTFVGIVEGRAHFTGGSMLGARVFDPDQIAKMSIRRVVEGGVEFEEWGLDGEPQEARLAADSYPELAQLLIDHPPLENAYKTAAKVLVRERGQGMPESALEVGSRDRVIEVPDEDADAEAQSWRDAGFDAKVIKRGAKTAGPAYELRTRLKNASNPAISYQRYEVYDAEDNKHLGWISRFEGKGPWDAFVSKHVNEYTSMASSQVGQPYAKRFEARSRNEAVEEIVAYLQIRAGYKRDDEYPGPPPREAGVLDWMADRVWDINKKMPDKIRYNPEGGAWSGDSWCCYKDRSQCFFPEGIDEVGSRQADYEVYIPKLRGKCPYTSRADEKSKCPFSEPGPHSGEHVWYPQAVKTWADGGQRKPGINASKVAGMNAWDLKLENERKKLQRDPSYNNSMWGQDGTCEMCGRKSDKPVSTELSIQGWVIPEGDARSGGEESQGWFDIGPVCRKKIGTGKEAAKIAMPPNRKGYSDAQGMAGAVAREIKKSLSYLPVASVSSTRITGIGNTTEGWMVAGVSKPYGGESVKVGVGWVFDREADPGRASRYLSVIEAKLAELGWTIEGYEDRELHRSGMYGTIGMHTTGPVLVVSAPSREASLEPPPFSKTAKQPDCRCRHSRRMHDVSAGHNYDWFGRAEDAIEETGPCDGNAGRCNCQHFRVREDCCGQCGHPNSWHPRGPCNDYACQCGALVKASARDDILVLTGRGYRTTAHLPLCPRLKTSTQWRQIARVDDMPAGSFINACKTCKPTWPGKKTAVIQHHEKARVGATYTSGQGGEPKDPQPQAWEIAIRCESKEDAQAIAEQFPKGCKARGVNLSTRDGNRGFVHLGGQLVSNGVNRGVNETGVKRYRAAIKALDALGIEWEWNKGFANSYSTQAEFEAAIA